MSYLAAIRENNDVLVWERHSPDSPRVLQRFNAPWYFYTKDPDGEYESIFGDKLAKHEFATSREFYSARNDLMSEGEDIFESDIGPELRILAEHYYGVEPPTPNVTFFDIEVDYNPELGFSSVENPYAPINSVALYHQHFNVYVLLAVAPDGETRTEDELCAAIEAIEPIPDDVEFEFRLMRDEKELLQHLVAEIQDSDIISGWNSDFFDTPYVGKRVEKVLGKQFFRLLSFPEAPPPGWREVQMMGRDVTTLDPRGRASLDYLHVFRKYEVAERPSYKLEAIAEEVLPELPKLEYEGSLFKLYRDDFAYFLRYNVRDTEILKGFEDRLGYIALANVMAHISCGQYQHVLGTLKLAELATILHCHYNLNQRVPNIKEPEGSGGIQGAMVLEPKMGMHEWIGSVDINSLYPSAIRSINISPEKIVGQFDACVEATRAIADGMPIDLRFEYENGESETHTAEEWRDLLRERQQAVSGFGTVFDQSSKGIIPTILEDWYDKRKEFQAKKAACKEAGDKEGEGYNDRLQYVFKIKLNSYYGALANQFFRFFDLRMGESTTGTGRMILRHQCSKANEALTGEYDLGGEAVIYGDTDSTYFETWGRNQDEAVMIADAVAEKVNDSFPEFMRETFLCGSEFDGIIKCGREVVSDRGIFVDKKRYILHLVDLDGYKVDKLKVMGLDTKKTTLPRPIAEKLNGFVEALLKGAEWDDIAQEIVDYKRDVETTDDVMSIGLPKGIRKVEQYTTAYKLDPTTRLPGHVAAALHYNLSLAEFNDQESMPITTGMKIKVFYLTEEKGRFKSIAIPTDIEVVPQWFLEHYQIDRDAHVERLVDNPLKNIFKAIQRDVPTAQSLVVDDLLSF